MSRTHLTLEVQLDASLQYSFLDIGRIRNIHSTKYIFWEQPLSVITTILGEELGGKEDGRTDAPDYVNDC